MQTFAYNRSDERACPHTPQLIHLADKKVTNAGLGRQLLADGGAIDRGRPRASIRLIDALRAGSDRLHGPSAASALSGGNWNGC